MSALTPVLGVLLGQFVILTTLSHDAMMTFMRTTVTLDAEVERLLHNAMQKMQLSFKVTLNQALRKGLAEFATEMDERPFEVSPHEMVLRPGIDPARANQLCDDVDVEAEAFVELTRQLEREDETDGCRTDRGRSSQTPTCSSTPTTP